jgi:hypothetical protein
MLGASVLPTERITHVGAGELAGLRDFNPAYVGSGSQPVKLGMSIYRLFDIRQQTFAADTIRHEQMKPLEHRSQNQN